MNENIASPKLAETRNLRDKQKKYPEPLEVYLTRGIKTGTAAEQNNKNNDRKQRYFSSLLNVTL